MKTLPEDFIQYTQELMGDELFQQLKQGIIEGEAPTSIRLNPFKCKEEKMLRANRFHGALPPVAISPPVLTSPSTHGSMQESITCRRLLPCSWIW